MDTAVGASAPWATLPQITRRRAEGHEARVALYARRFELGLNLWTGKPDPEMARLAKADREGRKISDGPQPEW